MSFLRHRAWRRRRWRGSARRQACGSPASFGRTPTFPSYRCSRPMRAPPRAACAAVWRQRTADHRGFCRHARLDQPGRDKLPYDVLFILNRFFQEMSKAVAATNGHYSQFTGDGLMALYGLNAADPAVGAADALRGARECWRARRPQSPAARRPAPSRCGSASAFITARPSSARWGRRDPRSSPPSATR